MLAKSRTTVLKPHFARLAFSLAAGILAVALQIGPAKPLAAAELPNFADLVERNAPSIVEISTIRRTAARSPVADSELEELLRRINPGQEPDLEGPCPGRSWPTAAREGGRAGAGVSGGWGGSRGGIPP